jgi:hypothetical protein
MDTIKGVLKDSLGTLKPHFMKMIGMKTGGMVPNGYSNDTFPARLSSGEFVVNNSLTPKLQKFLSSDQQSSGSDVTYALLTKLIGILSVPISVESNVEFKQETLAKIILNLNRNNARLA